MPQIVRRSPNGVSDFEAGPTLRTTDKRHTAVFLRDDTLTVFYSNAGDCREWIMRADVSLEPDWHRWQAGSPTTLLAPETEYEGAACPLEPSRRGSVQHPIDHATRAVARHAKIPGHLQTRQWRWYRSARQGCRRLRASRRSGAPAARSGSATRHGGRRCPSRRLPQHLERRRQVQRFPVPVGGGGMGTDADAGCRQTRVGGRQRLPLPAYRRWLRRQRHPVRATGASHASEPEATKGRGTVMQPDDPVSAAESACLGRG